MFTRNECEYESLGSFLNIFPSIKLKTATGNNSDGYIIFECSNLYKGVTPKYFMKTEYEIRELLRRLEEKHNELHKTGKKVLFDFSSDIHCLKWVLEEF